MQKKLNATYNDRAHINSEKPGIDEVCGGGGGHISI